MKSAPGRTRCHTNGKGTVIIPGIQFKKSLEGAAKLLKKKIPGKGASTWTQHVISGISPLTDIDTGIPVDEVVPEWIHCDAQGGSRGVSTRVLRCYPMLKTWHGSLDFVVFDKEITEAVFTEFLNEAGLLVGIGRFRAAVGGTKGKFAVLKVVWKALALPEIQKRLAA